MNTEQPKVLLLAAAELRKLNAELERKSDAIQRLWAERDSLQASMEQLLKALETDRQLLQQALDALEMYELETDSDIQRKAITALRDRLAQCDRCGKKMGGEGDIHTCSPPAAQQEPVVFYRCKGCGHAYEQMHPTRCDCMASDGFDRLEYYTAPPAAAQPAPVQTNCRHCGGPDNVICAGQCKQSTPPAAAVQEPLMEPEGRCKECLTYNGHQDGCSHATPPAAQPAQRNPLADAYLYLESLVEALDGAFISTWQSTAAWHTQLNEARDYLTAHGIKEKT